MINHPEHIVPKTNDDMVHFTGIVSSNVRGIGYNEARRVLEIEFSSGSVYRYTDVEPEVVSSLLSAKSVGAHFAKYIRPVYKSELVLVDENPRT